MRQTVPISATLLVFAVVALNAAVAQPDPAADSDSAVKALRALYLQEASGYEFFVDAGRSMKLTLAPEPVMTWIGSGDWSGDIFVWTRDGRPRMIGGIGSWPEAGRRHLFHEFHSLSVEPLPEVRIGDMALWSPAEGKVEQHVMEHVAAPAENERLRLVQMRRLAAEFEPHMLGPDGNEVLRMLPQPLYRYRDPVGDVVDGALFGWVFATTGTDLDFLLLLECRDDGEGPTWHYTPARFAQREMWLRYHGEEVWRVGPHDESPAGGRLVEPYVTLVVRTIDDAVGVDPRGEE